MPNVMPNLQPKAHLFFVISVSVSSSGSAVAAGVGPFAGIWVKTTTSFTITGQNGNVMLVSDAAGASAVGGGAMIWIEGAFLSTISTATAQFGVI